MLKKGLHYLVGSDGFMPFGLFSCMIKWFFLIKKKHLRIKEKVGEEGRMEGYSGLVRGQVWILFLV